MKKDETQNTDAGSKDAQRLAELLKEFRFAMLTTREGKRLASRPMTIAGREPGKLWFLTTMQSEQTKALEIAPRVQITCQSVMVFLSISGEAKLVKDQAKLDELWSEADRVWFPEGRESKDLVAIEVELIEGEYWDQSGLKGLKYVFEAAKAYLSGERLQADDDLHGKAAIRS